jgi:hypothetical protein
VLFAEQRLCRGISPLSGAKYTGASFPCDMMMTFVIVTAAVAFAGGAVRLLRRHSEHWDSAYNSGMFLVLGTFIGAFAQLQWVTTFGKGGALIEPSKAQFLAKMMMLAAVFMIWRAIAFAPPSDRRPKLWATAALAAFPIFVQLLAAQFFKPL